MTILLIIVAIIGVALATFVVGKFFDYVLLLLARGRRFAAIAYIGAYLVSQGLIVFALSALIDRAR